jgi:hypothetical protein
MEICEFSGAPIAKKPKFPPKRRKILMHRSIKKHTAVTGSTQKKSLITFEQAFKNHVSIEKNAFNAEIKIPAIALTAIIRTDIIKLKNSLL